jgi:glycosyltransferase involved in cell wall biosynthesis
MTISYVIPSINRESLHRTIKSIEMREGDEICLEFDLPRSFMWGNPQRNKAIERAKGDYLAFMDDDDYYAPGYRDVMEDAMKTGLPTLFKVKYPNGNVLWDTPEVKPGNVTSTCIFIPNKKQMFSIWPGSRNMADFIFINSWRWNKIVWREEIIAYAGRDDGGGVHHE